MNKRKILVPIDGTERSMHSLTFVKEIFPKDSVDITIMTAKEIVVTTGIEVADKMDVAKKDGMRILEAAKNIMEGYSVKTYFTLGYAADEILNKAKEEGIEIIVMTKSTKKGLTRMIGSVTTAVVKRAKSIVMIVPE